MTFYLGGACKVTELQTVTNTELQLNLDLETYMRSLNPETILAKIQQLHQTRKSENKVGARRDSVVVYLLWCLRGPLEDLKDMIKPLIEDSWKPLEYTIYAILPKINGLVGESTGRKY